MQNGLELLEEYIKDRRFSEVLEVSRDYDIKYDFNSLWESFFTPLKMDENRRLLVINGK